MHFYILYSADEALQQDKSKIEFAARKVLYFAFYELQLSIYKFIHLFISTIYVSLNRLFK